jgi:hypothetical protein
MGVISVMRASSVMKAAAVLVGALVALGLGWIVAAEAGAPAGGLPHHEAVIQAERFVSSSTPLTELESTPGPYLVLGWRPPDARPWYRIVWAVTLSGTFIGHCIPSEANACFPEQSVTVVIDYVSGEFVTVRYGS